MGAASLGGHYSSRLEQSKRGSSRKKRANQYAAKRAARWLRAINPSSYLRPLTLTGSRRTIARSAWGQSVATPPDPGSASLRYKPRPRARNTDRPFVGVPLVAARCAER